jgi:hypothetical protein
VITKVERSSETTGDLISSGNFTCWRKKACNVRVRMTQVETNNGRPGWAVHASYICDHVRRKCFGCGMTESSVTLPSLVARSDDANLHLLQDRISLLTFILFFSFFPSLYLSVYFCLVRPSFGTSIHSCYGPRLLF